MANKKFRSGLLVMTLVFGTAIIGCDNGMNAGFYDEFDFDFDDGSGGITYSVEADGTLNKDTSSKLIFKFDEPVNGLRVENISIIDSNTTGKAKKNTRGGGALTGDGTEWALNITSVTGGKIRVKIDKEGIERGRKTVAVYKDSATGENPDQAIKLTNALWQGGYLAARDDVLWYKFEAEAEKEYRVQAKTLGAFARFSAYKEDRTTPIFENIALTGDPWPISGVSGTVYLKVELRYISFIGVIKGNFVIRFFDPENMGPLDIIEIKEANATLDFSVVLKWEVRPAAGEENIESKGYRVYRSDTEDGTYDPIGEVPVSSICNYLDTTVKGGIYWYKVAGYNSKGEGEWSEPKKSGFVADVEAAKVLTIGTITKGELKESKTEDWYKFTAEAGKTYTVQYESSDKNPAYTAYLVNVSALKSDKTPISNFSLDHTVASGTISGVSGTVYLRVSLMNDFYGTYGIKVTQ